MVYLTMCQGGYPVIVGMVVLGVKTGKMASILTAFDPTDDPHQLITDMGEMEYSTQCSTFIRLKASQTLAPFSWCVLSDSECVGGIGSLPELDTLQQFIRSRLDVSSE